MKRSSPDDGGYGGKAGMPPMSHNIGADMQLSGSVAGLGAVSGPTFRSAADPPLSENPFAVPV